LIKGGKLLFNNEERNTVRPITILTGPASAGKNSVSHVYAMQFSPRCAVIDVDLLRAMLRKPHAAPWEASEGLAQHRLGVKHACMLARSFAAPNLFVEDCDVLILDVLWANLPQLYRQELVDHALRIVRLMPSWEETLRRLHARPPSITQEEAWWVYQQQAALHDFDYSFDNTAVSIEATAQWLASLP
jgi:hypothetical protein